MDEKALDEYNKQNNTSYTLLPNTNYEFESSAVIPAGKVVSNPVTITLHPLTTEQNKTGFVHALPLAVKAEGEAMPRCSKAPTHSSWPQRRFPIRT